jgi:uncharacterized membrane protein
MQIGDRRKIVSLSDQAPQEALQRIGRAYTAFHLIGIWGLMALVFAIGFTGWIRSVWMGILSTLGALKTIVIIFRFVGILIGSPLLGG